MQIYNYHPVTKEFKKESSASLDPVETKKMGYPVYMLPAHSTATPPPVVGPGQAAVFSISGWTIQEDHRGKNVWKKSAPQKGKSSVKDIGPIDADYTLLEPAVPYPKWDGVQWVNNPASPQARRDADFTTAFPSWAQVEAEVNAANGLPEIRALLKKQLRVLYWTARGKDV